jgi:putative ABC transport system permease protein
MINVYLKGTDNASFIENIKTQYGDLAVEYSDVDETINSQSSVYISAVFAVMVLVLAITVLVVVLILYLVIKTMILKRKREFGIFKATGYTTFQLMTQIMFSFVPIVIIGVTIGGVLGSLYTNSMLTLLLSGAGIHNVQFIIEVPLIIGLCIGLVVLSYLVSMIVSRRIKGISAYELITE